MVITEIIVFSDVQPLCLVGRWLPTPFASYPFTSPPVRHRVPSYFNWILRTNVSEEPNAYIMGV